MSDGPPELSRRILHALADELAPERRTWGEAPDLVFLHHPCIHHVVARSLGLPSFIWTTGPTPAVVAGLADAAENIFPVWSLVVPPGLIGVGLRCEAHYIRDLDQAEVRALSQVEVRLHPDAVTGRFMYAVDRNGYSYGVETDPAGVVLGGRIVVPGDEASAAIGTIPDALDRILSAVLGVTLPPRPHDAPSTQAKEPDSGQDQ